MTFFSRENLNEAKSFSEGEAQQTTVLAGDLRYELAYGKRFPRCQKCKSELEKDQYWDFGEILAAVPAGHIKCKRCGEPHTVRKEGEFVDKIVGPDVIALVGEIEAPKADASKAGKVMMFACLACGAGLKADGSSRSVECTYCNADNFLPNELWMRLHPVPKPVVFFMLVEN